MKGIGARIAFWYVGAASVSLALLFVVGYLLIEWQSMQALDRLNEAGFHQIAARLPPDPARLSAAELEAHVREVTEFAPALYYINVHQRGQAPLFRSRNLRGAAIPDVPGQLNFITHVANVGEMRATEFKIGLLEIMVATPTQPVRQALLLYAQISAGLVLAMVLASGVIGLLLSRMLLAPLRAIRDTARRIGSDNLRERIPVAHTGDEVADLAGLLNQMFDRLEASFEQIRRFTSDASHELKTPLSLVRLHAERMLGDEQLPLAHREGLQDQLVDLERLDRIIDDLLFLSRADAHAMQLDLQQQDPAAFLSDFLLDAQVLAEHHDMQVSLSHSGHGQVAFEARWMRQVLLNLLLNALNASPAGSQIRIASLLGPQGWRLSLEDEGSGLTPEQCARVFDRFVRYAPPGRPLPSGSGLGLAICRSIVGLHGGQIQAQAASRGQGLCVVVALPLA